MLVKARSQGKSVSVEKMLKTFMLMPVKKEQVEQRITTRHPMRKSIVYCIKNAYGLDTSI